MAPLPRRAACVGLPTPSVVVQWIYPNRAGGQVVVNHGGQLAQTVPRALLLIHDLGEPVPDF